MGIRSKSFHCQFWYNLAAIFTELRNEQHWQHQGKSLSSTSSLHLHHLGTNVANLHVCVASVCQSQHRHATVWHPLSFTMLQRLACISVKAKIAFSSRSEGQGVSSVTTAMIDICIVAFRVKAIN